MTADPVARPSGHPSRGRSGRPATRPLGHRLLLAFVVVALSSVAVLTAGALIGTGQGLASAQRADRQRVADEVAAAATSAYASTGTWTGADMATAAAVAETAGAQLTIRDQSGVMVWPGRGMGGGGMRRDSTGSGYVQAAVAVGGRQVGTVRLGFGSAITPGRQVAWNWVIGAGLTALAVALLVAWHVTRWLTNPLTRLARTANAFAHGDRTARSQLTSPDELGAVGQALDHLADEVVHAETVRRQLAADVAHELRTPLAALQAGLEELRDGHREPDPGSLAALHDQTLRLGRIVDDLAELSAAEAAALSLHLSNVDLADVTERALTARQAQLRAAGLHVVPDIQRPLPVRGDPDRLHQAVGNLLANAARYCRPGDQVTVRTRRADGHAVVEVTDTGPGIDPSDLPHIFDRLRRGHRSHEIAGSGIGLAVVRELITAHGGTVTATSAPGSGATFTVRVPELVGENRGWDGPRDGASASPPR